MNETIITLLIGAAVGVGLMMLYIAYRIKMVMNTLDTYIEEAFDQVRDSFVTILVEKDNDTYYCYRKEDRQFVCQGRTVGEVRTAFKAKYPDKVAIVSKDTAEDIVAEFKKELNEDSVSI
jgi:hypothetical protein